MSEKQKIYQYLIQQSLILSRSTLSSKVVYGRKRKAAYELAQLTHNLGSIVLNEEFTKADVHFMNYQAREFCEKSIGCDHIIAVLADLFAEIPDELKSELKWAGPIKQTAI